METAANYISNNIMDLVNIANQLPASNLNNGLEALHTLHIGLYMPLIAVNWQDWKLEVSKRLKVVNNMI